MNRIVIISTGYMWFPCESGTVRMYEVASAFVEAGYRVDIIVPDFQHHQKSTRDVEKIMEQGYPFDIKFAHASPYEKNISLKRIKSNRMLAKNLGAILEKNIKKYDGVLLSIPPNDVAKTVAAICDRYKVPLLVDVEDLWPKAMQMVLGDNFFTRIALSGFEKDAEFVYQHADAVIGTSPDYMEKAFEYRKKDIPHECIYVGCDLETFDSGVKKFFDGINKPEDEIWVTYAGSISNSYDIKTLVETGALFKEYGMNHIQINVLGDGTKKAELETYVKEKELSNVTFFGFTPYQEMASMLRKSDVLINSFVKGAPQSIVNKVADYLAAGRPMINTLENPVFCSLVEDNHIGKNISPHNPMAMKNAVLELTFDKMEWTRMGQNARALCEKNFDARKCNAKVIEMMERCVEHAKIKH